MISVDDYQWRYRRRAPSVHEIFVEFDAGRRSHRQTPRRRALVALLSAVVDRSVCKVVHLINRPMDYEGHSKEFGFSRASMAAHWRAGYHDAVRTLRNPEALERPVSPESVAMFDLAADARE